MRSVLAELQQQWLSMLLVVTASAIQSIMRSLKGQLIE